MTRRHPDLPKKVLKRDSDIVAKIMKFWEASQNGPALIDLFIKESTGLSDERYWEILRSVWIMAGSNESTEKFRKLLSSPRKQKFYFSTPEDAKKLRELPESITVWRACNDGEEQGIAWTTSKQYAERYQEMFFKSKIVSMEVNRTKIFAYIGRNLEDEVIIL